MTDRTRNTLSIEELQRRISISPFQRWLGLQAESIDANGVTLGLALRTELIGNPRTAALHGGIFGCLVDSAASFSIIALHGGSNITVDMRVDFHRSVTLAPGSETRIRAIGSIVRTGRTLATADARIVDAQGNLLASGRGVFMRSEPELEIGTKKE